MSRATRPRPPIVRVLSPLRDFLALEASGAILLVVAAVTALVWANSPWSHSYESLWTSRASLTISGHTLDLDLRHWINDGLMTIFFFVVGLEIKRELTDGHLSSRRAAALPAVAAFGGMIIPALVYLAIAGTSAPRGWAIPMATDIALAIGVLAVAGSRLPSSLRAFLLGLAIVDDIGAIVVIAAVYSTGIKWGWLAAGGAAIVLTMTLRRLGVHRTLAYVIVGGVAWYSLHDAGIHPTLAGVALGLLTPATPRLDVDLIDDTELIDLSDVEAAHSTSELARGSISVVEWLQHVLHPWTSFVIVPLFALANSGINITFDGLDSAVRSPITWGVFFGLLAGKPLGVVLATRLAVRAGIADTPDGAIPRQIVGIGAAAGIGFTVALFITELALTNPVDRSNAKLAILTASTLAAVLSGVLLTHRKSKNSAPSSGGSR
ncbi:MAG: Na+/H+ antiporter NhaA [Ilumatobacteraceae bacterium]